MQRGINSWVGAGNVASDVSYGQTHSGDDACNFRVAIEQAHSAQHGYSGSVENILGRLRPLKVGLHLFAWPTHISSSSRDPPASRYDCGHRQSR